MRSPYDIGDLIMREAYRAWVAAGSPRRGFLRFLWSAEKRIEAKGVEGSLGMRPSAA